MGAAALPGYVRNMAPAGDVSRRRLMAGLLVAALASGAACTPPRDGTSVRGQAPPSRGVVKIGVVGAFSGQLSYVGNAVLAGSRYAVDVWNDRRGVNGRRVQLVSCDGRFEPSVEQNCLSKLQNVDRVHAVVIDSPILSYLDPALLADLRVPVMLPVASPPSLDPTTYPNTFGFATQGSSSDVLAQHLVAERGFRRIGVVASDDAVADIFLDDLRERFAAKGVKASPVVRFKAGQVDMTPEVRRLQEADAEVMVVLGLGADSARVVVSADRIGYHPVVAGTETLYMRAYRELAAERTNDTILTLPHAPEGAQADPAFVVWLLGFFKRYGIKTITVAGSTSPDYPGLEMPAYSTVDAVLKAMRRVKSSDPAKVVAELERAEGFRSIGRTVTWDVDDHLATVAPKLETWVARFKNGHVLFDVDKRSVPPLEDARYAMESWLFDGGKKPSLTAGTAVSVAERWLKELEKRRAEIVARVGEAGYEQLVAESERGLKLARQFAASAKQAG